MDGRMMEMRIAMMAMTTRSSIRVKAGREETERRGDGEAAWRRREEDGDERPPAPGWGAGAR
jgi:hypothetical protein